MPTAIEFENISKQYRLGLVSTRTLSHDLKRWYAMNIQRKEDPYLKIGEVNDRAHKGESEYVWALRDINFKVEQGDVLGIIGKNGAGKSTLLKILSKVTAPSTGVIRARGRIASLLEVGTGFHPEMTGRENIFMNGAIMGMTKAEINRKLDEIVDFSGVERYLDTPVKRYSSGMTVRLGFAIAAHLEPEILVVDEVLAVGDAEFQKKAIGKMQDVSKGEGRTVLFVSHNMASIRKLCKTGILLEDGSVAYDGKIDDVINMYNRQVVEDIRTIYVNEEEKSEKISKIYLTNSKEEMVHSIYSFSEDFYLNVELKANNFEDAQFGCTIFTESGDPLMSTDLLKDVKSSNNEAKLKIKLPHQFLTAGSYYLEGVFFKKNGYEIEKKDYFMTITVEPRNDFEISGGKILGKFINPYKWEKS
jgi:lipopolysaccharide transport system ATP-binding protein